MNPKSIFIYLHKQLSVFQNVLQWVMARKVIVQVCAVRHKSHFCQRQRIHKSRDAYCLDIGILTETTCADFIYDL